MAHKKLKQRLNYDPIFFEEAALTIINHFEEIGNYFLALHNKWSDVSN
ncbi:MULTISPECIES: hypothetical protein [unclassified Microcoleus]